MNSSKESLTLPGSKAKLSKRKSKKIRKISKRESILDICSIKESGKNKNSKANIKDKEPNDDKNAQNSGANNGNVADKTRDSVEMNADIGFLIEKKKGGISRKQSKVIMSKLNSSKSHRENLASVDSSD